MYKEDSINLYKHNPQIKYPNFFYIEYISMFKNLKNNVKLYYLSITCKSKNK